MADYSNIRAALENVTNLLEQADPKTLSELQKSDIEYYVERHIAPQINRIKKGRDKCDLLRRSSIRTGIVS